MRRSFYHVISTFCLVVILLTLNLALAQVPENYIPEERGAIVVRGYITSEITQATLSYVESVLKYAQDRGAVAVVLVLNTPGGYLDATLKIVDRIANSTIPVIGYVAPSGARAWSAGTLILLATHIAAMAPGSIIGSAQPVEYDPVTGTTRPVNSSKILNAITKQFEGLAKLRGRNVTAARLFVLKNLNLEASEALKYHVIEVIASNIRELLEKVDGMTVKTAAGTVTLHTANAVIEDCRPSIRERILEVFANPLVSSILFSLGLWIVLFGVISAHYYAAAVGAFFMILGLLGLGFSVNIVALALLLLGSIFLFVEVFVTPGFGVLGITGILMLILGTILLPHLTPEKWLIGGEWFRQLIVTAYALGGSLGSIMGFVLYKAVKVHRATPRSRALIDLRGEVGEALDDIEPGKEGFVLVRGEYWMAKATEPIKKGEKVVVIGKEGPYLIVRKLT